MATTSAYGQEACVRAVLLTTVAARTAAIGPGRLACCSRGRLDLRAVQRDYGPSNQLAVLVVVVVAVAEVRES